MADWEPAQPYIQGPTYVKRDPGKPHTRRGLAQTNMHCEVVLKWAYASRQ